MTESAMQASSSALGEDETPRGRDYAIVMVWTERVVLTLLFLLFVVRGFLPAWKHLDADFANYYLAAHLYREGYPVERVYEWTWFQRQKDHAGLDRPLVGFIPATLTSTLLILPLAWLSPLQANRCWLVFSLGLLPLIALLLRRITDLPCRRIGVLMLLAVAPLHSNFQLGQVHLVLLLLLTLAAWLYFEDRPILCGVVLAAAAALKIYPALFLLFFVIKRQWRAAVGLAAGLLGAVLVPVGLFGIGASRLYFREVLPWGLRGEIIDPYTTGWDSMDALLRRLFLYEPELNPAPVAHLPHVFAILHSFVHAFILVTFLWAMVSKNTGSSLRKLEWATYCFLLLLLSSEPLPYHFVVLILTGALVIDYLIARREFSRALWIVVLYALVCVPYTRVYRADPNGWASAIFFPRLWCMLLLGGSLWWLLVSDSRQRLRGRLKARSFAYAVPAFLAVFAGGLVLDLRHLVGQFDGYRTRVVSLKGSAIATDAVVTEGSVFYGSLVPRFAVTPDTYSVYRLHSGSITAIGGGGDWFHPAATAHGDQGWAEVASANGSRVVRFDPGKVLAGNLTPITEVENAEQPVASADGKWLAYIRESRGRGSLWIRSLGSSREVQSDPERKLAGPEYDVRDAAFASDGRVFFSSWQTKRYRLYQVDLLSEHVTELSSVSCSARYPSLSPDGERMAFSCEHGGVWQLVVMNLRNSEQRQLTNADCNSTAPAWTVDSRSLIYSSDCGRALGITALSKISVVR